MSTKADWTRKAEVERFALPDEAAAIVDRAGVLTREEVARLNAAERTDAMVLRIAWDMLRDATRTEPHHSIRMASREAAWAAVNTSLATLGVQLAIDDDYWAVNSGPGHGAARAARFAACAVVAPSHFDPELREVLLRPWRSIAG